jgi:formylglycine-generating enzyme required for sulfatase activity
VRRFANWLHNGQPTGAEDATTTEDGAYTLNGATSRDALVAITRNSNAIWWLPSEDEWYKAAYYNPGTGTYFEYPTRTNSVPNNNQPASDTGNSANFHNNGSYMTGNPSYPYSDIGAYTMSASPFGTFDQGGNALEWTDSLDVGVAYSGFAIRGGGPENCACAMRAGNRSPGQDSGNEGGLGFRVASIAVPEPSTLLLALIAGALICLLWKRP